MDPGGRSGRAGVICPPGHPINGEGGSPCSTYIKAELWKVLHRRGVYVLLALLLLCTALFFMLYSYGGFSSLAKGISVTMVVGMLAAPLLVQLVDGGTADTLKNELSFGLRRGRSIGESCAPPCCWGWPSAWCWWEGAWPEGGCSCPGGSRRRPWRGWLWWILPGRGPAYLVRHVCPVPYVGPGGASSPAAWTAGYYLMFFMGQPVLVFLAILLFGVYEASAPFTLFTAVVLPYSLLMPALLDGWLTAQYQLWCWGIGLGWMAASTGLGLFLFGRRDVR